MLGQLLGTRFKVINILGSGGLVQTYIAEDTQRPRKPHCVLKHLTFASSNALMLQQVRGFFQAEVEALERLGKHDQIPQLLAYFEEEQEFYLVQELIEGHPLSDELTEGTRFAESHVVELLEDVLSILEFVHAHGVIHRDIKPGNLIRRDLDGKLILINFGAAKQIQQDLFDPVPMNPTTLAIGTSGYMPTEQAQGKPRPSSDLYALGIIGVQAVTGVNPGNLKEDQDGEIIWRDYVPQINEDLAAILTKMVRYHFKDRYQSASEVRQALQQVASRTMPPFVRTTNVSSRVVLSQDVQQDRERPRIEQLLLNQVKEEIAARLTQSLHNGVLISLLKQPQPQQVMSSWNVDIELEDPPNEFLTGDLSILEVFDRASVSGRLLILGNPGSGKTTTLLDLAQTLVIRAERQSVYPIPILLNLRSWRGAGFLSKNFPTLSRTFTPNNYQSIDDWLVVELKSKYGIPSDISKRWIAERKLLLMLEGATSI